MSLPVPTNPIEKAAHKAALAKLTPAQKAMRRAAGHAHAMPSDLLKDR